MDYKQRLEEDSYSVPLLLNLNRKKNLNLVKPPLEKKFSLLQMSTLSILAHC